MSTLVADASALVSLGVDNLHLADLVDEVLV